MKINWSWIGKKKIHNQNILTLTLALTLTSKQNYVITNYKLPLNQLLIDDYFPKWREDRKVCMWCKYKIKQSNEKSLKHLLQLQIWCSTCNIPLCCNYIRN